MKKLTRIQFVEEAKKGAIKIADNLSYVTVKMNSNDVKMNETFKKQLIDEGLYDNSFVGILVNDHEKAPFSMENFPVYGRADKYETKHLKREFKDAVTANLRERGLQLLDREFEARKMEYKAN